MSILDDLVRAGQLALYWDFRSGTFLDYSGHGFNGTVGGSMGSPRPWLDARPSGYCTSAAALPADNYSGCILLGQRHYTPAAAQYCIWIDATHYAVFGTGGLFSVYGAGTIRNSASVVGATCVGWNQVAGTTGAIYRDGSLLGAFSGNLDAVSLAAGTKYFFNASGGASPLAYGIKALVITSTVLSATQHSQLVADLATRDRSWTTRTHSIRQADCSVDPNTPGLVAAWDTIENGILIDIIGGKNGTQVGSPVSASKPYGRAIKFGYESGFTFNPAMGVTGPFSISFIAEPTEYTNAANHFIIHGASSGGNQIILFKSGSVCKLSFSASIGGTVRSLNATSYDWYTGQCRHIVCCYDGQYLRIYQNGNLDATSPEYLGATTFFSGAGTGVVGYRSGVSGNDYTGCIKGVQVYNTAKTAEQVRGLYEKSGLKEIQETSSFGVPVSTASRGGITGSYLENTRWAFGSTTPRYTIDVASISGEACKMLVCGTAGPLYKRTPSQFTDQQAGYGSWEWTWIKSAAGSMDVMVVASDKTAPGTAGNNGYFVRVDANEKVWLYKAAGVTLTPLLSTGNDYVVAGTAYTFRLTRTFAGVWTLWIRGLAASPGWTLVSNAGGGTNPTAAENTYTSSLYSIIDIDATDRVSVGAQSGNYSMVWRPFVF